MQQLDLVIHNATGLHARPARVFVDLAKQYQSTIRIRHGEKQVNAKSLISVLTLGVAMISGGMVREAIRAKTGFAVDPSGIPLLGGTVINNLGWRNHGTAVLGEMVSIPDARGCVGISHQAKAAVHSAVMNGVFNAAGAISSGVPPASCTARQGSVSSACSMPSFATRNAMRLPSSVLVMVAPSTACARGATHADHRPNHPQVGHRGDPGL